MILELLLHNLQHFQEKRNILEKKEQSFQICFPHKWYKRKECKADGEILLCLEKKSLNYEACFL